jgi:hypothetical protein
MKTLRENRYNTKPKILGTLASESDPQEGTPTLTSNVLTRKNRAQETSHSLCKQGSGMRAVSVH